MNVKGAIVIAFSGRRYLMVRHRDRAWEFPGGRQERGESLAETARREFFEETGLRGKNWKDRGIVELENGNLGLFSCDVSGRPEPATGEISESRYFTAPPTDLSFERPEYFLLLEKAGHQPKPRTDYDIASREFDNLRGKTATDDCWADAILRWGHIERGSEVLDIGCGTGRHSLCIMERCGARVFGVDRSPGMLEKANAKFRGTWIRGDALSLPFRDWSFDRAMFILVLQHVDDEPLAISEAKRVLAPGGRLLMATISHARIRGRHVAGLFPGLAEIDLDRFMAIPELGWHLRNQGFADVKRHIMRTPPKAESVDEVIERFRKRYISTLALVPEGDFERGLAIFEKRLRATYGQTVESDVEITFIEARKA